MRDEEIRKELEALLKGRDRQERHGGIRLGTLKKLADALLVQGQDHEEGYQNLVEVCEDLLREMLRASHDRRIAEFEECYTEFCAVLAMLRAGVQQADREMTEREKAKEN